MGTFHAEILPERFILQKTDGPSSAKMGIGFKEVRKNTNPMEAQVDGTRFRNGPGKYHEASDAVSKLTWMGSKVEKEGANVDGNIPPYCIVGQISESNNAPRLNEEIVEPLPTTAEI